MNLNNLVLTLVLAWEGTAPTEAQNGQSFTHLLPTLLHLSPTSGSLDLWDVLVRDNSSSNICSSQRKESVVGKTLRWPQDPHSLVSMSSITPPILEYGQSL